MVIRTIIAPLALLLALAGCVPAPAPSPEESPTPSVVSPAPSATASESPAAPALEIPSNCADLVPLATIRAQFASSFEPIAFTPGWISPTTQDFIDRGGLVCLWGIPQSDAGALTAYVAERATATDEQQIDAWQAAGYLECPPFLDACFYESETFEFGEFWTVHTLVEGFEMNIQAISMSIDPLLVIARAMATSMGYL
jgi:hypothetical protein